MLDEVIGKFVVLVIILLMTYAFIKQVNYTKSIAQLKENAYSKQLKRKHKFMTISLFGILVFFTMNIVVGLNIISSLYVSSDFTAIGAFVSVIVYLVAKFAMKTQRIQQPKRLYN